MSESRFWLREGEYSCELAIHEQPAKEQYSRFRIRADAEEFLILGRFSREIGELLAGDERASDGGREMIDGNLDLRCAHAFVRRDKALGQEITLRVVNEQHDVSVAIVLEHILGERIQRLRYVSGGGKGG